MKGNYREGSWDSLLLPPFIHRRSQSIVKSIELNCIISPDESLSSNQWASYESVHVSSFPPISSFLSSSSSFPSTVVPSVPSFLSHLHNAKSSPSIEEVKREREVVDSPSLLFSPLVSSSSQSCLHFCLIKALELSSLSCLLIIKVHWIDTSLSMDSLPPLPLSTCSPPSLFNTNRNTLMGWFHCPSYHFSSLFFTFPLWITTTLSCQLVDVFLIDHAHPHIPPKEIPYFILNLEGISFLQCQSASEGKRLPLNVLILEQLRTSCQMKCLSRERSDMCGWSVTDWTVVVSLSSSLSKSASSSCI